MRQSSVVTLVLASTLAVLLPAAALLSAGSAGGCGGCGWDSAAVSFDPAAPAACLSVEASSGWGCNAGAYDFHGDNRCTVPLTVRAAGTDLPADRVVPPGESFAVNVPTDAAGLPASEFMLDLGGTGVTLRVVW